MDPKMTPRIVLCESDECSPRGAVRRPHEITADCRAPRTVEEPKLIEAEA
ncbi:hypothetical protein [Leucobacter sp.]